MKKHLFFIAALSCALVAFSCSKEADIESNGVTTVNEVDNPAQPAAEPITISATLSDALTKVTFTPGTNGFGKPMLALTWQDTDKLCVADHSNHNSYSEFTLVSGEGTNSAVFTGTLVSASSYDVWVVNADDPTNMQIQASDGDASHIQYVAQATDVQFNGEGKADITFTEISSVLGLQAKLPAGAAATIKSVVLTASENIFFGGKTLTLGITTPGDAGTDDILNLYATLPSGSQAIPTGTTLFVKFNSNNASHSVYTAYRELGSGLTFASGALNNLKMNCVNTDKYAGKDDDGTSAHPYLIADPYQVASINGLATGGQTTYFKMIADVDMTGVTHNSINTNSGYTQLVNFDGNNKTISNLGTHLFYVFKGAIENLTLSGSNVTSRGILAEYCQGTGHTITNVDITNGTVTCTSSNTGGMIGRINNGTEGTASVTITNCTVSGTNVTGTGVVGGVLGFPEAMVIVSGCKYTGGTVTASDRYVGGFAGSTGNDNSTYTDCQVEEATVKTTYNDDPRCGGFVGLLQVKCQVKGCTVGTSSKKVTVETPQPKRSGSSGSYTYSVLNSGGFVGVNYGTITKNGDVRSKAYVKVTSSNTYGTPLRLGGFVGFGRGTIEYCDAIIDMSSLQGQYIGGFAGYVIQAGTKIDNCTVDGTVKGNNYTGGFAGYVDSGAPVISNCTASGSVTAQSGCGGFVGQTMTGVFTNCSTSATCSFNGSNNGGFVGQIHGGTMTDCSAYGSVTATGGSTYGGFVGILPKCTTLTNCSASGDVTGVGQHIGGFIGTINNTDDEGTLSIVHCHASGNVSNSTTYYNGGFCGSIVQGKSISIQKCYASGNLTSNQTNASAFIGYINKTGSAPYDGIDLNVTIENCYASGNIINSNQIRGGLIAHINVVDGVSVSNCYASGAVVGSFRLGGLIGNVGSANVTVEHCAAWNSEVTASSVGSGNWSSGAVAGTAFPTSTLTDNYRKPDMPVKAFWGNVSGTPGTNGYTFELTSDYQHPNVSSSSPLIICEKSATTLTLRATTATALASGQDNYPIFPYHGKVEAGKTLSQLASTTLGWSGDIWDFSGELPTLK